jgi:signal transduction histidine kinase/CheY-like chemotaxis protein
VRIAQVQVTRAGAPSPGGRIGEVASATREADQILQGLTGTGFLVSCGLAAAGALAFAARGLGVGATQVVWSGLALLAAVALTSGHAWRVRRRLDATRNITQALNGHRLVILVFGLACAWACWEALLLTPGELRPWAMALLVLQAGFGGAAAATDRATLALWLAAVVVLPAAAILGFADRELQTMAWLLAATGLIVLGLAARVRQMVARALRVRQENDQLVAQLRQQVALVEAANAEKSRFLGAASHDLRQPMHALGLFAASLEKELRGTPHHPKVVSMARAVDALEDSFGAMLDVSRLDAGIVQPNLQSFPIRDVYRRLHMHCAGQAEERGLSLRFNAGGKLVTSDPQLLERILSNLVHNAIRYTEQGGVVVVTRARGKRTSIEVWDTGVGIAAGELPRIFNEFYQVGNAGRDRTRGLGMGLSIVKRLVLLLGHELEVRSTPGRGSVFRVLLDQTELAEMPSLVLGADTIPSALDEDRTVLVIDDEQAVREGMKELLESWGFTVLLAASTGEACLAVRRHAGIIDVVVSDLRLGGNDDGIEAISQVRQQYGAPLPALLITGDTSAAEVKRAHDSGHPLLFKPVRTRDLFAALRRAP